LTNYEDLSPQDRIEIDSMVHDAYMGDDGEIRTNAEAAEVFDGFMSDAVQAHRAWAGILLDAWRHAGMKRFIHDRWKVLEGRYGFMHRGRRHERNLRRGTRVRNQQTGREVWIQEPLLDFTATQLQRAIAECAARIEEEQANIATYRALLDLLEVTGELTVRGALKVQGFSLEDYLASRGAA